MARSKKKRTEKKTQVQTARNRSRCSRINTFVQKMVLSIKEKNYTLSTELLRITQSEMRRGVMKGILHRRTASRKISNFNSTVKSIRNPEQLRILES